MMLRESRRFLLQSPVISLTGICVLSLGLGVFTLALTLLMAASSLRHPGMRPHAYATIAEATSAGGSQFLSWNRVQEIPQRVRDAAPTAEYGTIKSISIHSGGRDLTINASPVSLGFFSIFTEPMAAGRDFTLSEEQQISERVVILSDSLARSLFFSPQQALGRNILLSGGNYIVVGVAPTAFRGIFKQPTDLWYPPHSLIPLKFQLASKVEAMPNVWKVIPSFYVLAASDRASSATLARTLSAMLPATPGEAPLTASQGISTDPAQDSRIRNWLRLGLMLGVVFTLVSSLNFALLLLARTPRQIEEIRLKRALGAETLQLAGELVTGPALTVIVSVLAALSLCVAGLRLLENVPGNYGQIVAASWPNLLPTLAVEMPVAVLLVAVIAVLPVALSLREDAIPRMGSSSTATRRASRVLQIPVTLQISFCMGTWILGGMIVSSLLTLLHTPLGFDSRNLSVAAIGPGPNGLRFQASSDESFPTKSAMQAILDRVRALPGVESASVMGDAPFEEDMMTVGVKRRDQPTAALQSVFTTRQEPGAFHAIGTPLLEGQDVPRPFAHSDVQWVVINRSLAHTLWPDGDALNRTIEVKVPAHSGMPDFEYRALVSGIVADMRPGGAEASPQPTIYEAFEGGNGGFDVVVRGNVSLDALSRALNPLLNSLAPGLVVKDSYRVSEKADAALKPERQRVYAALGAAGAMAFISWIGLYGTLVYYVNSRRRELAVRICMGADAWRIRRIVLERAGQSAVAAAVVALPLWLAMAQLSSNDYLGRLSWSTGRALAISLACAVVSVAISLLPAKAASSIPPAEVLKEQ